MFGLIVILFIIMVIGIIWMAFDDIDNHVE